MSYIDKTYGRQLEEALRGLVSRPALGQPWFGFHASEVPAGVLLFTATTHSRVLYADFWKYIQDKNLVKTEEEWQSIYSEQGWCPFYSDGDGIDTFRMPSAPLYLHGANTLNEASQYVEAGLPNITGSALSMVMLNHSADGAFYQSSGTDAEIAIAGGDATYKRADVVFDASRSSLIYGNSNTVTPETSKMLFGVWAISAPQQPIPDATAEGLIAGINTLNNTVVKSVNGVNADAVGNVKDLALFTVFQDNSVACVRFSNGLQICWSPYITVSNGFRLTYPAAFNGLPAVTATHRGTGDVNITCVAEDGSNVLFHHPISNPIQVSFTAVGAWKEIIA